VFIVEMGEGPVVTILATNGGRIRYQVLLIANL